MYIWSSHGNFNFWKHSKIKPRKCQNNKKHLMATCIRLWTIHAHVFSPPNTNTVYLLASLFSRIEWILLEMFRQPFYIGLTEILILIKTSANLTVKSNVTMLSRWSHCKWISSKVKPSILYISIPCLMLCSIV